VNQKSVVGMLKKMGHSVEIAANGQEAVELFSQEAFDLVLMDIQMPTMDGFTATHQIRHMEANSRSRVPIIAMTAHAMKGYEQRCLDAGMDGYLAKPATCQQLEGAIAKIPTESNAYASPQNPRLTSDAWDPEKARARLGGDEQFLYEIIDLFLEENPKQLAELKQALSESNAEAVERAAHTLKGELSCLEIPIATRHARELEERACKGHHEEAAQMLEILEDEILAASRAMREFRNKGGTSLPLRALKSSKA